MGLTLSYVIRRVALFFAVIWLTATLNFVLVHLAPGDPTGAMLAKMQTQGATIPDSGAIITAYRKTFGLDQPLPVQYLKYLAELSHGNMGYSLNNFPARVSDIIAGALPWTIGLVLTATIIAFVIGTLLGALMAWQGPWAQHMMPGYWVVVGLALASWAGLAWGRRHVVRFLGWQESRPPAAQPIVEQHRLAV